MGYKSRCQARPPGKSQGQELEIANHNTSRVNSREKPTETETMLPACFFTLQLSLALLQSTAQGLVPLRVGWVFLYQSIMKTVPHRHLMSQSDQDNSSTEILCPVIA